MTPDTIDTLYQSGGNPYYIVAPPYAQTSAGVRALYLLCHSLNRRGRAAYIVISSPWWWHHRPVMHDLIAPHVTPQIIRSHFERGLTPIMVYPETISGNPCNGACVVRYVLNFPGLLAGDKTYAADELCFSYSKIIAAHTRSPDNVLFIPTTDTRVFRPAPPGQKRRGSCFYASKYQIVHKGELFDVTKDSVEITRDLPTSQTPQQIADLFHRSDIFYTYENTALATEAVLCGCPAVFLPNPYLTEIIAAKELGPEGYAWGTDPDEIARAKATVGQGANNYLKTYATYWRDLDRFIALTQEFAEGKPYKNPDYTAQLCGRFAPHNPRTWLARVARRRLS